MSRARRPFWMASVASPMLSPARGPTMVADDASAAVQHQLGESGGVVLGDGPVEVTVVDGHHAQSPVGLLGRRGQADRGDLVLGERHPGMTRLSVLRRSPRTALVAARLACIPAVWVN